MFQLRMGIVYICKDGKICLALNHLGPLVRYDSTQSMVNVRVNITTYHEKRMQTMEHFYINAVIPHRPIKHFFSSNLQHFQAITHQDGKNQKCSETGYCDARKIQNH